MGKISRFVPKAERIAKVKAQEARQVILDLGLPQTAAEDCLLVIARHENGGRIAEWTFNMLNPSQCLAIWNAIRDLPASDRPDQVRHLFDLVLTHIETNTGLVTLTREELAELVSTAPCNISRMMGTLERLKVVFRERKKVAGMRGPGIARYRLNPHVAWNGELVVRAQQAAGADQPTLPGFEVIQGGRP